MLALFVIGCNGNEHTALAQAASSQPEQQQVLSVVPGAERIARYLPLLQGKKIGLTVNHSSRAGDRHLVDTLLKLEVGITRIYAPEHGFRGTADAGEKLADHKDPDTGLQVVSLYGSKRKPLPADLEDVEVMVFDIQDVGVRFYTYISTLHLVMEACAAQQIPVIVLDRPNPNGYYVDGPLLDLEYQSFVGMHPIPVVYGLTMGELAMMINGEGWLEEGLECDLTVVPCANYDHTMTYDLPVAPSPNLPNLRSILLYPSLCFFEPTTVSIGRGTDKQFQVVGHPGKAWGEYQFTPIPKPGAGKPKHQDVLLTGFDLTTISLDEIRNWRAINLDWLVKAFAAVAEGESFFTSPGFFDKLAGSDVLRKQLLQGMSAEEITASWQPGLETYSQLRKEYLLYPDFE